jgi:ABC-2 type transport system permease protein
MSLTDRPAPVAPTPVAPTPVAPISAAPSARRARPVSTRFLRSELGLMFRRRRNIAILVVLGAIPVLIGVAVKVSGADGGGGGVFGSITDNGIFVSFAALVAVIPLFLPMAVAVVAGESVAGEANTGTLRYLLVVPVARARLLAVKFASLVVWCVTGPLVVAVVGVIVGLSLFPHGEVTLLSGTQTSLGAAVWRLLLAVGYVALMMLVVGTIGLFVSTLTEVPIAAMASALAVAITSEVLEAVPQLHAIHPWLFSHYWLTLGDFLRDPLGYEMVRKGALLALGYIVVFGLAAWARFSSKDVSS